ncbi:AraC family transcriptional regulator [Oscillatoria amoena NRMC-F 0135]|uniref:AraC family transcriptional regulator n=1 Tax=Geitlerinema calcuttense NRMC-F 0142 TaxID=2922238 RepID=A0ABT7LZM6_9CYAN|nr:MULTISPECIES: AraC family transcriptional regulator [Cyanophyceae]MDL5050398.1 AraC family transcriptional regulator [Oscillatoria amoena NRMC-F 0135]MDL5054205.1 AraC family transcriptional regulator [Oscillatoria laete-virens NRMC-F 0139]MDL5057454.1 AraC family transcriptional regulator [Geitlerinema calcuttense NRMC-F 0142]
MKKKSSPPATLICLTNPKVPGFAEFGSWTKDKRQPLEYHRNKGVEIVLVTKGHVCWQINGRECRVKSGEVFWSFPWEIHGSPDGMDAAFECLFVIFRSANGRGKKGNENLFHPAFELEKSLIRRLFQVLNKAQERVFKASGLLKELTIRTVEELSKMQAAHPHKAHAMGKVLLLDILDTLETREKMRPSAAHPGHVPLKVRNLVDRLNESPHHPWSLQEMSGVCGLKRTMFTDYFIRLTGDSPMMWLNRVRVRKARERLAQETSPSMTDIALDCGFSSSQYFAKVFKDYTGMTPTDYSHSFKKK